MIAVGFRVSGSYPRGAAGETFLDLCEGVFEALAGPYPFVFTTGRDLEDRPTLFVGVHPAGEPMFITDCGDEDRAGGRFVAWANTAPVGPGYHVHVCELFHELVSRLGLRLDPAGTMTDQGPTGDTTGYFYTRDRAAVERCHLRALAALCRRIIPICEADPHQDVTLSLPNEVYFETEAPIQTMMGPRPLAWAKDLVAAADAAGDAPGADVSALAAVARGVFPWYEVGQRAPYHLGRALYRMWCDVHWTVPTFEPDKSACFEALDALDAAYREDPTLDFPWCAWNTMIHNAHEAGRPRPPYMEQIGVRMNEQWRTAQAATGRFPMLGYRLGEVTYRLGDWRVHLGNEYVKQPPFRLPPGAELPDPADLDDEQLHAALGALTMASGFVARHDQGKTVHIATLPLDAGVGAGAAGVDNYLAHYAPPKGKVAIGRYEHAGRDAKGVAFLYKESAAARGAPAYVFSGVSVVPGQVALTTITYADREDREEAERIWRSVDLHLGDRA